MHIQKLVYFISVANNLSFTKAARECHIAQTAMSRHISALENELGVTLFDRNNRHVQVTEEGKDFYAYATEIVETYNRAVHKMNAATHQYDYNLRIGIGPYESILLAPFFKNFNQAFSRINISCLQFNYAELSTQLSAGALDVMFSIDHCAARARDAEYFTVYNGPWGIISASGHRFAEREEVSHKDLTGETIVTMSEYNFYDYKKSIESKGGFPAGYIRVNSYTAKVLFTRAGFGVAFVPLYTRQSLQKDLNFSLIGKELERSFVCAYLPGRNNDFFKRFIEHVRTQSGLLKETDFY